MLFKVIMDYSDCTLNSWELVIIKRTTNYFKDGDGEGHLSNNYFRMNTELFGGSYYKKSANTYTYIISTPNWMKIFEILVINLNNLIKSVQTYLTYHII